MTDVSPKYSICICNYNMVDTLEISLSSIIKQINDDYEIVIVDDGSSDGSLAALEKLRLNNPALQVYALPRDRKRKLGLTRNYSIERARGEYVLLHLDCDDVYGPYIEDFVKAFHQVEKSIGRDILLSGQHINMGRRDFLLKHGAYRNIFRGEDRDLWSRLAATGAYIPFYHIDFVTRLPKSSQKRYWRSILYTFDHLVNDFRSGAGFSQFFKYEFKKWPQMSMKLRVYRILCILPAYVSSLFLESLPPAPGMGDPEKMVAYRKEHGGSLETILAKYGATPDWSVFSPDAVKIFKI